MKIKRDKVVLNLAETPREKSQDWTGLYSHVIDDKVFYRLDSPAAICYAIKEGNKFVKPDNNTVMTDSMAVHNFRVFVDTNPAALANEKYKAIGGYHTKKKSWSIKELRC